MIDLWWYFRCVCCTCLHQLFVMALSFHAQPEHFGSELFFHLSSNLLIVHWKIGLPNFLLTMLCCSQNQMHKSSRVSTLIASKVHGWVTWRLNQHTSCINTWNLLWRTQLYILLKVGGTPSTWIKSCQRLHKVWHELFILWWWFVWIPCRLLFYAKCEW